MWVTAVTALPVSQTSQIEGSVNPDSRRKKARVRVYMQSAVIPDSRSACRVQNRPSALVGGFTEVR